MKRRELVLLGVLVVLVVGVAAFLVPSKGWGSLFSFKKSSLQSEIDKKSELVAQLRDKKRRWEQYRTLSLPGGDRKAAQEEYHKYLSDLLADYTFTSETKIDDGKVETTALPGSVSSRNAKPPFTRVSFKVTARGELRYMARFLEKFYNAPKLQQIRSISIHKPDKDRTAKDKTTLKDRMLDMDLVVDALILEGTEERKTLDQDWYHLTDDTLNKLKGNGVPKEMVEKLDKGKSKTVFKSQEKFLEELTRLLPDDADGIEKYKDRLLEHDRIQLEPIMQLAVGDRPYWRIDSKNIFYGPRPITTEPGPRPPVVDPLSDIKIKEQILRYVRLSSITKNPPNRLEATLKDLGSPVAIRLRPWPFKNDFEIHNPKSENAVVLKGHVCKIDHEMHDVYFRVDSPSKDAANDKGSGSGEKDVKAPKDAGSGKGSDSSKGSSSGSTKLKDAGSGKVSDSSKGSGSGAEKLVEMKKAEAKGEGKYYRIHIGQSLEDALKTELSKDEVKALGLMDDEEVE